MTHVSTDLVYSHLGEPRVKRVFHLLENDAEVQGCLHARAHMDNPSGVFQVDEVLGRKILTSGIAQYLEVVALMDGEEIKTI